jgi:hypothetical protein
LALPEYDRGPAPDDLPTERILLVLQRAPEQESALRQLLQDQQVKSSPNYHNWLTPEQFGQQFGPADADIQAVTDWLTAQGFQVNRVAAGRTVIEFSGTAGLVRNALHTEIHKSTGPMPETHRFLRRSRLSWPALFRCTISPESPYTAGWALFPGQKLPAR